MIHQVTQQIVPILLVQLFNIVIVIKLIGLILASYKHNNYLYGF